MYKEYFEKLENLKGKELKNTELKAEKIELGVGKLESELKNLDKLNSQIDAAGFKLLGLAKAARKSLSSAENQLEVVKKSAKDLGVSPKDLPVSKTYDFIITSTKTLFKTFNIKA